jgi:hypothetical protein
MNMHSTHGAMRRIQRRWLFPLQFRTLCPAADLMQGTSKSWSTLR